MAQVKAMPDIFMDDTFPILDFKKTERSDTTNPQSKIRNPKLLLKADLTE
jgi:hypothetical protein